MRTLFYLEPSAVRGGIEIFAERHAAALRAEGHAVDVASEIPADFSAWDEIVVHKCSDVAALERFPPEKTTLYVHDHDPICPRSYAYTPLRRNCTRASGIWPCLFCAPLCRNWRPALGRVLAQGRRKRAMARLRRIVVISEFMKSRLVANGIPAEKIAVEKPDVGGSQVRKFTSSNVTEPANLQTCKPANVQTCKPANVQTCKPANLQTCKPANGDPGSAVPAEPVDLLFVGQLIRGKGVQLLLRAMARMKTRRTLDVVGAGNLEPALRALADKLGLADRVRFRGFRTDPQAWMRAAACVVVPSVWQEPYGLVAAEAVALGRPVVAFAIGGLPEACGGRATLVPPGDVAALAAALEKA